MERSDNHWKNVLKLCFEAIRIHKFYDRKDKLKKKSAYFATKNGKYFRMCFILLEFFFDDKLLQLLEMI